MRAKITPNITRLFTRAIITGVTVVALSFILPIVPCLKQTTLADAALKPGLCTLPNPFIERIPELTIKYYGINPDPLGGLVIQFIATVAIFMLIFMGIRKKAGKVLDLTKK